MLKCCDLELKPYQYIALALFHNPKVPQHEIFAKSNMFMVECPSGNVLFHQQKGVLDLLNSLPVVKSASFIDDLNDTTVPIMQKEVYEPHFEDEEKAHFIKNL